MKIKFLKPFRLYNPIGDDMMMDEGAIENMEKEDYAEWLIDSGFAEEVIESGWWKPKLDETYYCLNGNGIIMFETWCNDELDESLYSMGNCFKTKESAERHRDYLEAVETVRHDEGFMKGTASDGVYSIFGKEAPMVDDCPVRVYANTLHFDTRDHAIASLQNHTDEWLTILNYDWSKE